MAEVFYLQNQMSQYPIPLNFYFKSFDSWISMTLPLFQSLIILSSEALFQELSLNFSRLALSELAEAIGKLAELALR